MTLNRVVEIRLTNGMLAKVDFVDHINCNLGKYRWYGRVNGESVYATTSVAGISIPMHSMILPPKPGYEIDHRDRDTLNNTRANLRYATKSQNRSNRTKQANSISPYKGVTFRNDTGRWRARISRNRRRVHLGFFDTPEAAGRAYDRAARELHGEFACCNFSDESD